MAIDLQQERAEAHALVDQLPPDKLVAARSLLKALAEDEDELTEEDRVGIRAGVDSLARDGGVSMEEVLADFGLTMADFEKMADDEERIPRTRNG